RTGSSDRSGEGHGLGLTIAAGQARVLGARLSFRNAGPDDDRSAETPGSAAPPEPPESPGTTENAGRPEKAGHLGNTEDTGGGCSGAIAELVLPEAVLPEAAAD